MTATRPIPQPDAVTQPYWDGVAQDRLLLPRCRACAKYHFYPRAVCPHCGSADLAWEPVSGRGSVYSFTVVHQALSEAFKSEVPYVIAVIALAEGPHMMCNIVGGTPDNVRIGMPVEVTFREVAGARLPFFQEA